MFQAATAIMQETPIEPVKPPDIVTAAQRALQTSPRGDLTREGIQVQHDGDALVISGEVDEVADKKIALEQVSAVPGVDAMIDSLHVRTRLHRDDQAVAADVESALTGDPAFADCSVTIQKSFSPPAVASDRPPQKPGWMSIRVEQGVVVLDGDVPTLLQRRLAGLLAWWVPGVRDVADALGVLSEEVDGGDQIASAMRAVLERDPDVGSPAIEVRASGSVVTLDGRVNSSSAAQAAERDAWCLLGVNGVENRLAVEAGRATA
jgi:osmotically-inducible protein OsmY